MYKRLLLKTIFLIFPFILSAQYSWDIGGGLGATNFLGAIGGVGPAKPFIVNQNWQNTRFDAMGFVRYKLSPLLSFEGALSWNRIAGDDQYATKDLPRKLRNLSFRNDIIGVTLTAQVYFYEVPGLIQNFKTNVDLRCYVFGGISFFHDQPKAKYIDGTWVALEPLLLNSPTGNIADREAYPLWNFGIPMGIGTYFAVNRKHRWGFEFCWNETLGKGGKYLDDVADNGKYINPLAFNASNSINPAEAAYFENRSATALVQNGETKTWGYNYLPGGVRGAGTTTNKGNSWFSYNVTYSYAIRGKSSFYKSKYPGLFGKAGKKRKIRAKF